MKFLSQRLLKIALTDEILTKKFLIYLSDGMIKSDGHDKLKETGWMGWLRLMKGS